MTFSATDWLRLLSELGVKPTTAAEWAQPFADEVQPENFSAGMPDLPRIDRDYIDRLLRGLY